MTLTAKPTARKAQALATLCVALARKDEVNEVIRAAVEAGNVPSGWYLAYGSLDDCGASRANRDKASRMACGARMGYPDSRDTAADLLAYARQIDDTMRNAERAAHDDLALIGFRAALYTARIREHDAAAIQAQHRAAADARCNAFLEAMDDDAAEAMDLSKEALFAPEAPTAYDFADGDHVTVDGQPHTVVGRQGADRLWVSDIRGARYVVAPTLASKPGMIPQPVQQQQAGPRNRYVAESRGTRSGYWQVLDRQIGKPVSVYDRNAVDGRNTLADRGTAREAAKAFNAAEQAAQAQGKAPAPVTLDETLFGLRYIAAILTDCPAKSLPHYAAQAARIASMLAVNAPAPTGGEG